MVLDTSLICLLFNFNTNNEKSWDPTIHHASRCFFSFTQYPAYNRVGRGNVVLRYSVLHFLLIIWGLVPDRRNENINNSFVPVRIEPTTVASTRLCPCITTASYDSYNNFKNNIFLVITNKFKETWQCCLHCVNWIQSTCPLYIWFYRSHDMSA